MASPATRISGCLIERRFDSIIIPAKWANKSTPAFAWFDPRFHPSRWPHSATSQRPPSALIPIPHVSIPDRDSHTLVVGHRWPPRCSQIWLYPQWPCLSDLCESPFHTPIFSLILRPLLQDGSCHGRIKDLFIVPLRRRGRRSTCCRQVWAHNLYWNWQDRRREGSGNRCHIKALVNPWGAGSLGSHGWNKAQRMSRWWRARRRRRQYPQGSNRCLKGSLMPIDGLKRFNTDSSRESTSIDSLCSHVPRMPWRPGESAGARRESTSWGKVPRTC